MVEVEVFTFYKPLVGERGEIFFGALASRDADIGADISGRCYIAVRFPPNICQERIVINMEGAMTSPT